MTDRFYFLVLGFTVSFAASAETLRDRLNAHNGRTATTIVNRTEDDRPSLDQDIRRFFDNPAQFLDSEWAKFADELRKDKPEVIERAEQLMKEYSKLGDSFQRFRKEHVEGKSAKELSRETWDEIKKRSQELRSIEASLNLLLDTGDIASIAREFRRNPPLYLSKEAEKLVKRIKNKNPEKVAEFERELERYRKEYRKLEDFYRDKVSGKDASDVAESVKSELRLQSETVRLIEDDLGELASDLGGVRSDIERVVNDRDIPGQLRSIENDFNSVREKELKKLEDARNRLVKDLNRFLKRN